MLPFPCLYKPSSTLAYTRIHTLTPRRLTYKRTFVASILLVRLIVISSPVLLSLNGVLRGALMCTQFSLFFFSHWGVSVDELRRTYSFAHSFVFAQANAPSLHSLLLDWFFAKTFPSLILVLTLLRSLVPFRFTETWI